MLLWLLLLMVAWHWRHVWLHLWRHMRRLAIAGMMLLLLLLRMRWLTHHRWTATLWRTGGRWRQWPVRIGRLMLLLLMLRLWRQCGRCRLVLLIGRRLMRWQLLCRRHVRATVGGRRRRLLHCTRMH